MPFPRISWGLVGTLAAVVGGVVAATLLQSGESEESQGERAPPPEKPVERGEIRFEKMPTVSRETIWNRLITAPRFTDKTYAWALQEMAITEDSLRVGRTSDRSQIALNLHLLGPETEYRSRICTPGGCGPGAMTLLQSAYVLVAQQDGSFIWKDENGNPLSFSFDLGRKIVKTVLAVDVEGDGDEDLFLLHEDGGRAISYNIQSRLERSRLFASARPPIGEDTRSWLEDLFPDLPLCVPELMQQDLIALEGLRRMQILEMGEVFTHSHGMTTPALYGATEDVAGRFEENATALQTSLARESGSGTDAIPACEGLATRVSAHSARIFSRMEGEVEEARRLIAEDHQRYDGGIGVVLNPEGIQRNGSVTINRVILEGPAEKEGLKAGDQIVAVGDQTVAEIVDAPGTEFGLFVRLTNFLKGPFGSQIEVTLRRNGRTREVVISREFNLLPIVWLGRAH